MLFLFRNFRSDRALMPAVCVSPLLGNWSKFSALTVIVAGVTDGTRVVGCGAGACVTSGGDCTGVVASIAGTVEVSGDWTEVWDVVGWALLCTAGSLPPD